MKNERIISPIIFENEKKNTNYEGTSHVSLQTNDLQPINNHQNRGYSQQLIYPQPMNNGQYMSYPQQMEYFQTNIVNEYPRTISQDAMDKMALNEQKFLQQEAKVEKELEIFTQKKLLNLKLDQAQRTISKDSLGAFHLMVCVDGKCKIKSPTIFSKNNLELLILNLENTGEYKYLLRWDGLEEMVPVKKCSVKEFAKALERGGVAVLLSREQKKLALELVWAYLLSYAKEEYVARFYGWYQLPDGSWKFEDGNGKYYKYIRGE